MANRKLENQTVEVNKVGLYSVLDALISRKPRKFSGPGGSQRLMRVVFGDDVNTKQKIKEIREVFREYQKSQRSDATPIPQSRGVLPEVDDE